MAATRRTRARETRAAVEVETPAVRRPGMVRDRVLSPVAGYPKGWRNKHSHPLDAAKEAGQISADEYDAGDKLRQWLELEERSGRDSTDIGGPKITGTRGHDYLMWPELVTDARRGLGDMRSAMVSLDGGQSYLIVCERFCAGYSAREACKAVGIDAKRTWETIRLALTKLAVALCQARVRPYGQTR